MAPAPTPVFPAAPVDSTTPEVVELGFPVADDVPVECPIVLDDGATLAVLGSGTVPLFG